MVYRRPTVNLCHTAQSSTQPAWADASSASLLSCWCPGSPGSSALVPNISHSWTRSIKNEGVEEIFADLVPAALSNQSSILSGFEWYHQARVRRHLNLITSHRFHILFLQTIWQGGSWLQQWQTAETLLLCSSMTWSQQGWAVLLGMPQPHVLS